MAKKIKSIRGMSDLLPSESWQWRYVEQSLESVLSQYCFQEIRFPILESTQLFKRSVGEVTDIVEKEMYTFLDRNEESVTLRPEGTAGCVRAAEQNALLYNQTQRLWYKGPMFRYERPQKGRLRQFHQIGVEAFGFESSDADLEIIQLTAAMFNKLGMLDSVCLEINTIGDSASRLAFADALLDYLKSRVDDLDADSQKRLSTNPLRILDSKDTNTQLLLDSAPALNDFLNEDSKQRFALLCERLDNLGLAYKVNPRLVRGLDYYNDTVFEWISNDLGAQATVCAGGRYDSLVETLGGKSTPAVGFGIGLERLVLILQTLEKMPAQKADVDLFIIAESTEEKTHAFELAQTLRDKLETFAVQVSHSEGSMKSQMKKADKSGAAMALVVESASVENDQYCLKYLRQQKDAVYLKQTELVKALAEK